MEDTQKDFWPCACFRHRNGNCEVKFHHVVHRRCRSCGCVRPEMYDEHPDVRHQRFTDLNATPSQIAWFLRKNCPSGVNLMGSTKKSMARTYAEKETYGRSGGLPAIPEETFAALVAEFGLKNANPWCQRS